MSVSSQAVRGEGRVIVAALKHKPAAVGQGVRQLTAGYRLREKRMEISPTSARTEPRLIHGR